MLVPDVTSKREPAANHGGNATMTSTTACRACRSAVNIRHSSTFQSGASKTQGSTSLTTELEHPPPCTGRACTERRADSVVNHSNSIHCVRRPLVL
eukprot:782647-Amphidinium_carterae.3